MSDDGRLARAVRERRAELMLSQAELALAAGVSEATVRSVEAGRRTSLRPGNRRALATAAGWAPNSIDRIIDGQDPVLSNGVPLSTGPDRQSVIVAALERIEENVAKIFAELGQQRADLAAQWIEPDLSDPDERKIWETTAYTVREKLAHIALKRQAQAPAGRRRRRPGTTRPG